MLDHPLEMESGIKLKFLTFPVHFYYCAVQKMTVLPAITLSAHCRGPRNDLNGTNPANKSSEYQHYITKQIEGKKKRKIYYNKNIGSSLSHIYTHGVAKLGHNFI